MTADRLRKKYLRLRQKFADDLNKLTLEPEYPSYYDGDWVVEVDQLLDTLSEPSRAETKSPAG